MPAALIVTLPALPVAGVSARLTTPVSAVPLPPPSITTLPPPSVMSPALRLPLVDENSTPRSRMPRLPVARGSGPVRGISFAPAPAATARISPPPVTTCALPISRSPATRLIGWPAPVDAVCRTAPSFSAIVARAGPRNPNASGAALDSVLTMFGSA